MDQRFENTAIKKHRVQQSCLLGSIQQCPRDIGVASVPGQRRRQWPSTEATLGQLLVACM